MFTYLLHYSFLAAFGSFAIVVFIAFLIFTIWAMLAVGSDADDAHEEYIKKHNANRSYQDLKNN